ncbi:MAG: hypothetical protein M1824_005431 [Vezdaea acicularis]|nr:MAG: hypothetical protein M1824_005431 [Vezdaea acicularis]
MTLAGLNTINLSTLNTFQQVLLFLLIMLGSAIAVSAVTVMFRKRYFELKFRNIVELERTRTRERRRSLSRSRQSTDERTNVDPQEEEKAVAPLAPAVSQERGQDGAMDREHITWDKDVRRPRAISPKPSDINPSADAGLQRRSTAMSFTAPKLAGRNSNFYHLTQAERDELGGLEYRALKVLALVVPLYFILWQLFGAIGIGAYMARNNADVSRMNGLDPWWTGAFVAISAFNNSGMSLLDANMIPFSGSIYILITTGLLILVGNTGYPIVLRFLLWAIRRLLPNTPWFEVHRDTLQFLLDHPRRCYTNLFQSRHTWYLLLTLVTLNGIDWIAFEVLNVGNPAITSMSSSARAIDGIFQALAVRSGGFYIVAISSLRIGLQVLYVIMMYVSVYPVVITMRNSNVYEEKSLGIYRTEPSIDEDDAAAQQAPHTDPGGKKGRLQSLRLRTQLSPGPKHFVEQQLRLQLAHDLWALVLAVLFITIIETGSFEAQPDTYSVFNIIFEVVSAYGCVGISVGLPNQAYSFCGGWHSGSKLLLCLVMLRGRHRGLPVSIDKAILLPGRDENGKVKQ